MINRSIFISFMWLLLCAALSAACSKESVVTNAPAQSASPAAPSAPTPAQAAPASSVPATATATATPHTVTAAATPSPTQLPVIKQAQAQPGVPVPVPDAARRPLTGAEFEKALQQLPPEVRARIQGMRAATPPASPQPTKKP